MGDDSNLTPAAAADSMHEIPGLRVAAVDTLPPSALSSLRVLPQQRAWVGPIADLLADAALCPGSEPMAILHGDTPVGYYRIEPNARSVAGRDFLLPALGLRAFFVDAGWQGRGIGSRALAVMLADLAQRHREARLLVLTASADNGAALRLYQRAGFIDHGELYHGGCSGSQRLLLRNLP